MTKSITIYRDASWKIPITAIPDELTKKLISKFTYFFYKESACQRCEFLEDRHSDNCDACSAFLGKKATGKILGPEDNDLGVRVVSIPRGARIKLSKFLRRQGYDKFEIKKTLPKPVELSRPIKITATLRPYQVEAVDAVLEKEHGVVCAPPRAGKTLIGAAVISRLGMRALILASQRDWLMQFQETFIGSSTQPAMTNAKARQIGFPKNVADFEKYDVCLATFQQFMSESGKAKLEKIRNLFPIIIVDECHGVPALQTARVLAKFNSRYTIGLSGTPDRKTGDYVLAEDLIGPVLYEAKVERLRPEVDVFYTPGTYEMKSMGNAGFTYLVSKLESSTPRRNAILKEAIRRAENGHLVLIPMSRVDAILKYVQEINAEKGRGYALPFYGGLKKDQRTSVIASARNYECKILVGNVALLATGLNIPRASCLIDSGINSNIPKAIQRFSRILTPLEGKPNPLIVFPLDDCDMMRKTRRNEYWNALFPTFNPIVKGEVQSALNQYFSSKKNSPHNFDFKNGI